MRGRELKLDVLDDLAQRGVSPAMRGREIKRNDMSSPLALNDDHPKVPRIVTPEAG